MARRQPVEARVDDDLLTVTMPCGMGWRGEKRGRFVPYQLTGIPFGNEMCGYRRVLHSSGRHSKETSKAIVREPLLLSFSLCEPPYAFTAKYTNR